jgi:hypothetical protein
MRHSMQRMFGGIGGGARMPPGFSFPGMQPDERMRSGRKTYEATAEKPDDKLEGPKQPGS